MAAGATVCEVAPGATQVGVPLFEVLNSGDFAGGRLYLPPGWNGSTTQPMPGTWTAITGQSASLQTGTAILVVPQLPAVPIPGVRVYLLRPSQIGGTIGTVNQGGAGTAPWPVTDQPVVIPGTQPDGTTLAADGSLLTAAYAVPGPGFILLAFAVSGAASASAVQHTRDGGTTWYNLRRGRAWEPGNEYNVSVPVVSGDQWNVRVASATTIGTLRALFAPSI